MGSSSQNRWDHLLHYMINTQIWIVSRHTVTFTNLSAQWIVSSFALCFFYIFCERADLIIDIDMYYIQSWLDQNAIALKC